MHALLITDFASVSLPCINLFRGSFYLDSTDSSLDCNNFDQIEERTVLSLASSDTANNHYLRRASTAGDRTDHAKHYHAYNKKVSRAALLR